MDNKEATVILELGQDFDQEEIRRNYISRYVEFFRLRAAAVTISEIENLTNALIQVNQAFELLSGLTVRNASEMFLALSPTELTDLRTEVTGKPGPFELAVENLIEQKELGLAIRFLEIGLTQSINNNALQERVQATRSIRLLGKTLIHCGLIDQGIRFTTYGMDHYDMGLAYASIGDHKSAVQNLAYELSLRESLVPIDKVCQTIATSYFQLGDYQNAVNVIEEVMPKLMPKKEIFPDQCRSEQFALIMLISIEKLTGLKYNKLNSLKLRIRFPLSFKYFQNCFGSLNNAFRKLEELTRDSESYDSFLESLRPASMVKENVEFHYDIEDLQSLYYEIFKAPIQKSLLYHPK